MFRWKRSSVLWLCRWITILCLDKVYRGWVISYKSSQLRFQAFTSFFSRV